MTSSDARVGSVSLRGYQENRVSDTLYHDVLWPRLEAAIDLMLSVKPGEAMRISFEETYSAVYRIVCQGYGSTLFEDLMHKKIDCFIDTLDENLQKSQNIGTKEYVRTFNDIMKQFTQGVQSLLSVFAYLSRCVVEGGLQKALYGRLNEKLVSRHIRMVLDHLRELESRPFEVDPAICASIIKTLYGLDEDNVKLQPELFKKFIPGLMISTLPCQLSYLSSEAKVMSQNLRNAHTSQTPQDEECSRKRPHEDAESAMDLDET